MKHKLFLLLAVIGMMVPQMVFADVYFTVDDIRYWYEPDSDWAEIASIGEKKRSSSFVIPSSVSYNGKIYRVTGIGDSAFYGWSGLTSITIPNSVTTIGSDAFHNCRGLTSVTIPNSVTSIYESAFKGCSGLTSITIPNSVTLIYNSAFEDCRGLASVTIPNSVTSIYDSAFKGCSGLTSITIPNSVTSIYNSAFEDCRGLTSVTIPNSVTSIYDSAFKGCTNVEYLNYDNNKINPRDFGTKLKTVVVGNSVTSIGSFSGCSGLTAITVEKGNIKYDSRENCNAIIETASNTLFVGIKNTIIPNSVTRIGGGPSMNAAVLLPSPSPRA